MLLLIISFLIIHFGFKKLDSYKDDAHKYPDFFNCVNLLTSLLLFFTVAAILGNKWLLYSTSIDVDINFKMDIKHFHLYKIPLFIPLHVGLSENMLAFHLFNIFSTFVYIIYITHPRIYANRYTHLPHEQRMSALLGTIRYIIIRVFLIQIIITIIPDLVLGILHYFPKKIAMFIFRFIFKYPLTCFLRYCRHHKEAADISVTSILIIKATLILLKTTFFKIKAMYLYFFRWFFIPIFFAILAIIQHGINLQDKTLFRRLYLKIIPYPTFWNLAIAYLIFPWSVVIAIYIIGGTLYAILIGAYEYHTDPDYFFYAIKDFFLMIFYPGGDVPGDPGDPNNDHMNRR